MNIIASIQMLSDTERILVEYSQFTLVVGSTRPLDASIFDPTISSRQKYIGCTSWAYFDVWKQSILICTRFVDVKRSLNAAERDWNVDVDQR